MPWIPGTPLRKKVPLSDEQSSNRSPRGYSGSPLTVDNLISDLKIIRCKHPDVPISYLLYKSSGGNYSRDTFRTHFGSWANALKAAGGVSAHSTFSNEDLFDEMQRLWEQFGRQPTFDEMQKHGKVNPHTYHNRFGGWIKAVHAFCDDRNNDPTPGAPPEIPDSTSVAIEEIRPALPNNTPNANSSLPALSPILVVLRQTGRAVGKRLRFRVLERDKHTCQVCGRSREKHGIALVIDHKVAYSNGGETVYENLQALCEDCNLGKSNL
jgi:hypothetical protein